MPSNIRPPDYGTVIANPINSVSARPASDPIPRYRPVRDTVLRARGIRPEARVPVAATAVQVPRAAPVRRNAIEDLVPPTYTQDPTPGIDRMVLARGAVLGPGLGQRERLPLSDYNKVITQVSHELNATMGPLQRRLARAIAITGTLVSVGGAIAAGVLSVTALGSVLSGIGLPLGAIAAIAGVAVFVIGSAMTLLASVAVRALMRAPIDKHPALGLKLETLRDLRDDLLEVPKRSRAEQDLLRNINRVLGKVDGAGAHFKAQLRVMGKTQAAAFSGVFFAGVSALAVASSAEEPIAGGKRALSRWFGRGHKPMANRAGGDVSLPDASQRLQLLRRVIVS